MEWRGLHREAGEEGACKGEGAFGVDAVGLFEGRGDGGAGVAS